MLKYYDVAIVTAEVPDEITLAINISNCPGNCGHIENGEFKLDCSEPWLLEDVGTPLTTSEIEKLIKENSDITCIGFMGGDNDIAMVGLLTKYIHSTHPELKVAMYSGREFLDLDLAKELDYYKIGRFIMPLPKDHPEEWWKTNCGVIGFPFSNQLMFKREGDKLINITHRFRETKFNSFESLKKQIIYPEENN